MIRTCKTCQATFDTLLALNTHKREIHGWVKPQPKGATRTYDKPATGLEGLYAIQDQFKAAIEQAEADRAVKQQELVELDNAIARFKEMLVRNGR